MVDQNLQIDQQVQDLIAASDVAQAADLALRTYGREVYGFLLGTLRDESVARDAYSLFCEDLWRGLPGFQWRSSLRTWAYTIARHAGLRARRSDRRRLEKQPESSERVLAAIEAHVRTVTREYLRTEVKQQFAHLRDALPAEDRMLLILRVDKQMEWDEIARVTKGDAIQGAALARESARLRKRFQLIKDRLRELAQQAGLLDSSRRSERAR